MCVSCAVNAVEQGAAAGSSSAVPALLATSASALGMRKLGARLVAMDLSWISAARMKAATVLVVTLGLIAVASVGSG